MEMQMIMETDEIQTSSFVNKGLPLTMELADILKVLILPELNPNSKSLPFYDRILLWLVPSMEKDIILFHGGRGVEFYSLFDKSIAERIDKELIVTLMNNIEDIQPGASSIIKKASFKKSTSYSNTDIWFNHTEEQLRKIISSGDTPFLGLSVGLFKQNWKSYIAKYLRENQDKKHFFIKLLFKWPAVFATYLTLHIVEGYGKRNNHEVYPFINMAINGGSKQINDNNKELLWKTFRRSCLVLGLDVLLRKSGTNYMVDEYLQQCGVPLKYIPALTKYMLQYAYIAGLPEKDDPASIHLWKMGLQKTLTPISVTVRNTLEADNNDYYVQLFVRLLLGDYTDSKDTLVTEKIMFETIEDVGKNSNYSVCSKVMLIPRLAWRDDVLGVELPANEDILWKITLGDESFESRGHIETQFFAFDSIALPSFVVIENNQKSIKHTYDIWNDGRNNRFLIFDNNGYFVTNGKLVVEKPIIINPGEYIFVSRFKSCQDVNEIAEISQEPLLFQWKETLLPDAQIEIKKGPAKCIIQSLSIPLIIADGESIQDIKGKEIYLSKNLSVNFVIPKELIETVEKGFIIKVKAQGVDNSIEIDCTPDTEGKFSFAFETIKNNWNPILDYFLIELRQRGVNRAILRKRLLIWNGLNQVKDRIIFLCDEVPENLDINECENVDINKPNPSLKYLDESKRTFRMFFKLSDKRNLNLFWSIPGVFLHIEDYSSEEVVELPIKKGVTHSIKSDSREVLEIRTTYDGILTLGNYQQVIKKRIGKKRIHFSSLVEYLAPGADTLSFQRNGSMINEPLLKLVTPHQVTSFFSESKIESHHVTFSLTSQAEEIRCKVIELFNGIEDSFEIKCNDPQVLVNSDAKAIGACSIVNDVYEHHIQFNYEQFDKGAWIIDFEVKINGRWGVLSNLRDDVFSTGFIVNQLGEHSTSIFLNLLLGSIDEEDKIIVFERFHKALLICYAQESWDTLRWISDFWQYLIVTFDYQSDKELGDLIRLSEMIPPDTASSSWFPLLSIGSFLPEIYIQNNNRYQKILENVSLFSEFPEIKKPYISLFRKNIIDSSLAGGFKNFLKIAQQNEEPCKFDFKQYKQVLKACDVPKRWALLSSDDWRPGKGDYLGALHYHFALDELQKKYRDTLEGNERRRGHSLLIVNRIQNSICGNFIPNIPMHLLEVRNLGFLVSEPEEGWSLEEENLQDIIHFLCMYAAVCRWDVRTPGSFLNFTRLINDILGSEPELEKQSIGYLLYVGSDIFDFYLLLWEVVFSIDYKL